MKDNLITDFVKDVLLFRSKTPYYRKAGIAIWIVIVLMLLSLIFDYKTFN